MKLIKDKVIREIIGDETIKIFLENGWVEYKEEKKEPEKKVVKKDN